jgi:hypothetical protein
MRAGSLEVIWMARGGCDWYIYLGERGAVEWAPGLRRRVYAFGTGEGDDPLGWANDRSFRWEPGP